MKQAEMKIVVNSPNGVHSRVATKLAKIASRNKVTLCIICGDQQVDCSSVLDILSMAFVKDSSLTVRAHGELSAKAVNEVKKLLSRTDV